MADSTENVALVTQTLVGSAARALDDPRSASFATLADLCALCEAAVLLDRMEAFESSEGWQSALGDRLAREGLYRTFQPSLSYEDLRRLSYRLPGELARRTRLVTGPDGIEFNGRNLLAPPGENVTGLNDYLKRIGNLGGYRSADTSSVQDRAYRANGYLVVAAAHGLDYFPDFDRVPFVAGTLHKVYRSLPVRLYDTVAESLTEPLHGGDVVSEWSGMATIPIPPISALVLSRASSLADVPEQLLRVRADFARYRRYFAEFRAELREADTIRERVTLRRRYQTLLAEAAGPHRESVSLTEMLNLTEKVVKAASGPQVPTNYSALLVAQPVEWIRRWWRRRPLAVLFRMDGKLPRLSEYRRLVHKLWGEQVGDRLLDQSAAHALRSRALLAEAESTVDRQLGAPDADTPTLLPAERRPASLLPPGSDDD